LKELEKRAALGIKEKSDGELKLEKMESKMRAHLNTIAASKGYGFLSLIWLSFVELLCFFIFYFLFYFYFHFIFFGFVV
jgi:hypothetical protein